MKELNANGVLLMAESSWVEVVKQIQRLHITK
jgi:hypothetical protein